MLTDQWWNFFYLCGSSAATLTGLTFVAVTFGQSRIKKDNLDQVNIFLSPFCYHFMHVFILCVVTAIPGANSKIIATSTLVTGLWRLIKIPKAFSIVHAQAVKGEDGNIDASDWIVIVFMPMAVYLALIVAGIGFFMVKPWAVGVLAAACLVLLLNSVKGVWDMLLWIASTQR
jgi:hypothetical protein